MPYLLILLSLAFVSCGQKKTNELSSAEFKSSLEQKSFQTVTETDSIIYFRGKLLNSFVEEKIPSDNLTYKISNRDELTFAEISDRDLKIYTDKEKSAAKVIVSYADRTEIFFLPENVPLEIIPSKLNLKNEAARKFKWVTTNITKTFSGAVLYLVSLNLEDIIQNDQRFYKETFTLGQNFASQNMKLVTGKSLELSVDYSVLLQGEVGQQFAGRGVRCTRDLIEAGGCGQCSYTRNVPSGSYSKTATLPLNELGFSVKIGDQVFSLNEFNPIVQNENFKIEINSSTFDLRRETSVQLLSSAPAGISKHAPAYNYAGFCATTSDGAEIALARKVEASVTATLLGRGAEFLKGIL